MFKLIDPLVSTVFQRRNLDALQPLCSRDSAPPLLRAPQAGISSEVVEKSSEVGDRCVMNKVLMLSNEVKRGAQ